MAYVIEVTGCPALSGYPKSAELTGTAAVLVTNRTDWSAQQIITLYLQRWPIEISQPYYGSREPLSLTAA